MQTAANSFREEKIVLIGKTSLVNRFCKGLFSANISSTVGAAFSSKKINVGKEAIQLNIWDTAGSEKYRSLAPMYYRDARGAIVVVDITNPETLTEADEWIQRIREGGLKECVFVIACNKCDLCDKSKISFEELTDFSLSHQVSYFRNTSALSGEGVEELFNALGNELIKISPLIGENDEINQLIGQAEAEQTNTSSSCC